MADSTKRLLTDETGQDIVTALNAIAGNHNVSDAYDSTKTYAVGDMCIYNNTLYKCKTAINTAEAWNSSHWDQVSVGKELTTLNNQIGAFQLKRLSNFTLSTSTTITIPTSSYHIIVTSCSNGDAASDIIITQCNSTGVTYAKKIGSSQLTTSTGTNSLTITGPSSSSSTTIAVFAITILGGAPSN